MEQIVYFLTQEAVHFLVHLKFLRVQDMLDQSPTSINVDQ